MVQVGILPDQAREFCFFITKDFGNMTTYKSCGSGKEILSIELLINLIVI